MKKETFVQVITSCDIPRDKTLREVIDEIIDKTDWKKFESILCVLDEDKFRVEINIVNVAGVKND